MKNTIISLFSVLMFALVARVAEAAPEVDVSIQIIHGSKSEAGFGGPARRYQKQLERAGFKGGQVLDTVTAANRSVGSSVELRFKDEAKSERKIKVTVLDVSGSTVKLQIEIPDYKFKTSTTHRDGGTLLTVLPGHNLALVVWPGK